MITRRSQEDHIGITIYFTKDLILTDRQYSTFYKELKSKCTYNFIIYIEYIVLWLLIFKKMFTILLWFTNDRVFPINAVVQFHK